MINTNKIKQLIEAVGQGLYEKDEAIRLAMLCAFAGENLFMIGAPGTAKSMISRRVSSAFKQVNYFEYLMNEFSTPDEIFGSVKLKGLDEGIYEKNTDGYLPQAQIAFLDEIWKSGPAILNTLLTIINEKKFHNGNKVEKVPLHMLLSASNELPKEKAGLEALYDRFVVRLAVAPVTDDKNFFQLCEGSSEDVTIDPKLQLTIDEVRAWQKEIEKVILPNNIKAVIVNIRKELERLNATEKREEKEMFYVSDRRWKKIVHLLKTSAFVCGRNEVDLMDCQLISYCIWNTDKQRKEAEDLIRKIAVENGYKCNWDIKPIQEEIDSFAKSIDDTFYVHNREMISQTDPDGDIYYQTNHRMFKWVGKKENKSYRKFYESEKNLTIGANGREVKVSAFLEKDRILKIGCEDIEIQTREVGLVRNTSIFNNQCVYDATKATFEKERQKVFDHIQGEIDKLKALKQQQEKSYRGNLFVDSKFSELLLKLLLEQINDMITKTEDQLVVLDKQQVRYEK